MLINRSKLSLARLLIPFGVFVALGFSFAESGFCFRRYSPEKNACKEKSQHDFVDSESEPCCEKHGEGFDGYALELKRSERDTMFYECIPCPKEIRTRTKKLRLELTERRNEHHRKLRKIYRGIHELKKQEVNDDDVWSPWSDWGPCSKTCGDGVHQRTRFCLQASCKEEDYQEKPCADLKPCIIDGVWTAWSDWSVCNVTCGEGYEERVRSCANPAPENGGQGCEGLNTEWRKCRQELLCPVDGGWSVWSDWTTCSATCGEGFQTRSRQCNSPLPQRGGKPCEGIELESMPCVARTNCAVDGNWTEWSKMDICSAKPCSGEPGYRTRFRSCTNPRPMFGGKSCKGRSWKREVCYNNDFCTEKVDGGWCDWSIWSQCKAGGMMKRSRICDCPPSANDGKHCKGDDMEERACITLADFPEDEMEDEKEDEEKEEEEEEDMNTSMKATVFATKRDGCYDNEGSGDGSDVNCDQEAEENSTTEEPGSGDNQ